jgi:predicted signal transduction protein with EAL and GGDEF domain
MVVAEGIETERQYLLLKSYGCDFGQGFYIAQPLSCEDAARFMGYDPNPDANVAIDTYNEALDNTDRFPTFPPLRRRRTK